jgi:DNA-binding response OmpR family regulator
MSFPLSGCAILVVEDEALIALHIADAFECAGARVVTSHSLKTALQLFEAEDWSAAVLDHILGDEDSSPLCHRLTERNIPFVLYSAR